MSVQERWLVGVDELPEVGVLDADRERAEAGDDQDRVKANYRGNFERLVQVKRVYDPDNLFHLNQNIKP